jgi:rhamnulose-1-phosphate aldolase
MPIREPFPDLDEILASIGEAGSRIAGIGASEGGAGNISACIGWPLEVRRQFSVTREIQLPLPAPHLAGWRIIVTGSGRRLRDIGVDPAANLGVVLVHAGGETGTLHTSPRCLFDALTSEWNSHLGVHDDTVARVETNFHAVMHAQPPHLVYLSHVPEYLDEAYLNLRLLRWEPETIVNLPQGVGVLPFMVPGSSQLMAANIAGLRTHRVVLWAKHGVMARSDISVTRAADRIEYAETAARYEYMDLLAGQRAEGLSRDEMRAVVAAFNVRTDVV